MSTNPDYRSRLSFDIDTDLKDRLRDQLGWGDIKLIYTVLTKQLVELLETHDPDIVKAGIVSKTVRLNQLIDFKKAEDKDEVSTTT